MIGSLVKTSERFTKGQRRYERELLWFTRRDPRSGDKIMARRKARLHMDLVLWKDFRSRPMKVDHGDSVWSP